MPGGMGASARDASANDTFSPDLQAMRPGPDRLALPAAIMERAVWSASVPVGAVLMTLSEAKICARRPGSAPGKCWAAV